MKKSGDLISVIVPIYNAELYLARCLETIINQTYKSIEIILVNDGSTDNSLEICIEFQKKDSRIVLINQKNKGVSEARNMALKEAKGKYIYFSDADDYLDSSLLSIYYNEIKNADLVISDYFLVENKVCKKSNSFEKNITLSSQNELDNFKMSLLCNEFKHDSKINGDYVGTGIGFTWNKLFKKEIIDKNNIRFPKNVILSEDVCFIYKYLAHVVKVRLINKALYYHEVVITGATLRYKPEIIDSERKFVDETIYITKSANSQVVDAYYCRLIRMISWDFISYVFHKDNKENKKKLIKHLFNTIPEYKVAIKKAKYRHLSKKQAIFLFLLRHKQYWLISILI